MAGGLALGIMMIPIIARTTEELLLLVPGTMREGALALGATRARAVFTVLVPAALPGIVTGVVLALARIAGETAPLLFTAFNNRFFTTKVSQPIASLTVQVFTYAISPYADWHRQAWAGARARVDRVAVLNPRAPRDPAAGTHAGSMMAQRPVSSSPAIAAAPTGRPLPPRSAVVHAGEVLEDRPIKIEVECLSFFYFAEQLEHLKHRLLNMGGLAEERVRMAMRALVDRDPRLLAQVTHGDQAVNDLHVEIDDRCFKLLALHQPMAVDLRVIVAVVKINSDLERVGDLAVNIAEAAERYVSHAPVKAMIDLPRMGDMAQRMLREALDSFVSQDIKAARDVLKQDDLLDALKGQIFRELLTYMLGDPRTIESGIDLILISRHLERVGDHATNIAEDVIFIVEARDVRHHAADPAR